MSDTKRWILGGIIIICSTIVVLTVCRRTNAQDSLPLAVQHPEIPLE